MWGALRDIAGREKCRIHDICSLVHMRKNSDTSLTAAIRVFLMLYYRAAATDEGHRKAGHGHFERMLSRAQMSEGDRTLWDNRKVRKLGSRSVSSQDEALPSKRLAHN